MKEEVINQNFFGSTTDSINMLLSYVDVRAKQPVKSIFTIKIFTIDQNELLAVSICF